MKKLTTEEFITKAKQVHGDKYDYSKVEYIDCNTKITIICPIHGEFQQSPSKHLYKQGCPKCKGVFRYNTQTWIEEAIKRFGNKYDYSKVQYKKAHEKICIICPEHGEFYQTPANHLYGQGCPKCADLQLRKDRQWSQDHFIEEAIAIHGDKYNYSKVNYINQNTKVEIICSKHGSFQQIPSVHLRGSGCPVCGCSHGERAISDYLDTNMIKYIKEYNIEAPIELRKTGICRIDFYIPKYNLFIEYNGIQHYQAHEYFGGEEGFQKQQERDNYVRQYAKQHNLDLLEIKYTDDVNFVLNTYFNKTNTV